MVKVGEIERITQNRVVMLLANELQYKYLGVYEDRENNSNIEQDALTSFLKKKGYSDILINRAINELQKVSGDQSKSLYDVNKEVYHLLRYGSKQKEDVGQQKVTVHFIDWEHPEENQFSFAEEVTVLGEHTKRPDIVIYINGIAVAVLELKRSTVSVSEGIRQNIDNQKSTFIRPFFSTMQFVMAGNDTEGLRYGTIETPEKYYLTWKEEHPAEHLLDKHLHCMLEKKRFMELLHDFIVFDRGIKKLCRVNQYFGIKAAQEFIRRREGGIIWHTQGSGKSLVMVWLTKWIRENITNSRVLIITDRDELDKQIEKVFKGVNEDIVRTKSGADLIQRLNTSDTSLMCSLIHKFGNKEEPDYEEYIEELKRSLPPDFKAKGDIYVLVDECHRTQSGKLHKAMKMILPNALFIGFTGTPLLKSDKETSIEIFGRYIHTYKFDEAVADKVVLDLLYEARDIDQYITSQSKIDQWFESKTKGLNEYQKTQLKMKWGTMQRVLSSKSRLEQIVKDVVFDMNTRPRLMSGRGNAMLVSGSIYQACKYYELFQQTDLAGKCAIVTSYVPNISDTKGEASSDNSVTDKLKQYEIYVQMLNGKSAEEFEDLAKKKFTEEPAQLKLLIVVDKLLTGFDAPSATYLYIDKSMQDHGLFQAICRVNRLDGDDKEYGYIIDYKDLFKSLEKSIKDYTSEAFHGYSEEDVKGLLTDRLKRSREHLEEVLESLRALIEPVELPKEQLQYIRFFCGNPEKASDLQENEPKRVSLYKLTSSLIRAYAALANDMEEAGYTFTEAQAIKSEVEFFVQLRDEIKNASGEKIDLKAYEPDMRYLIDSYIKAEESEKISEMEDLSLIQLIVERGLDIAGQSLPESIRKSKEAMAETIENNIRRLIIEETPTNPKYFQKMSELLDELVKERKKSVEEYQEYLKKIFELCKKVKQPEGSKQYPSTINTRGKQAIYDNVGQDKTLAAELDREIRYIKKDSWRGNKAKEKEIRIAIRKYIQDDNLVDAIFEIIKNQPEY